MAYGTRSEGSPIKMVGGAIVAVVMAIILLSAVGCDRINAGHVGIVVNLAGSQRGVQDFELATGWVFFLRFKTQVLEYPTFMQTAKWTRSANEGDNPESGKGANEEISFQSAEGMNINADISVSYHLVKEKIPEFYLRFRSDDIRSFTHGFFRNLARDGFIGVGENYRVEEIIGGKKEEILKKVRARLQEETGGMGVVIDQLGFIEAPRPPQAVTDSLNAKVQATQLAMQKQNELMQAQAEAAKNVAYAEGDAKAAIARAEGQAAANRKISESISPNVLEWRRLDLQNKWMDKWSGGVPTYYSGQGGNTLMFQMPGKQ